MSVMEDDFEFIDESNDIEIQLQEPVMVTAPPSKQNNISINRLQQMITDLTSLKYDVESGLNDLKQERKSLATERKKITTMQNNLTKKITKFNHVCKEQEEIFRQMENQRNEYQQLNLQMRKEIDAAAKTRLGIEEERTKLKVDRDKLKRHMERFKTDGERLDDLLSQLSEIPDIKKRSISLTDILHKVAHDTTNAEKELEKIREIRKTQQQFLNESKIETEKIHQTFSDLKKKQEPPLIQLDELRAYACKTCGTHIASKGDIESRCYQVGQGHFTEKKRGFLFTTSVNLDLAVAKTEQFTTGSYDISWASCKKCASQIGWKYLTCDTSSNSSKVGKFCLARYALTAPEDRTTDE